MSNDQDNDDASAVDDDIPTFAEAVKQRKDHIAWLKKQGDRERADRIAQCSKGNRCNLDDPSASDAKRSRKARSRNR